MASTGQPTSRQARLGAELRKLRETAGMSGAEAAALLGGERSLISHVEAGRWGIKPERVQYLASHYAATNKDLVDALIVMARERGGGWWDKFRGVLPPVLMDLAELESHATYLRTVQALIVPGIFQTEEYARAIISTALPGIPDDELEARVEHRMLRRSIFERKSPPQYEAIFHEAALRINYGSRATTRRQLEFLLECTELPHVSVRVIPFDVEAFIGLTPQLFYAGGPLPQLDTAVIETAHDIAFTGAEAQLTGYRKLFASFEDLSMSPEDSIRAVRQIIDDK